MTVIMPIPSDVHIAVGLARPSLSAVLKIKDLAPSQKKLYIIITAESLYLCYCNHFISVDIVIVVGLVNIC